MAFLQSAYLVMVFTVPIAGVILNTYVLRKLIRVARKSVVRFETTSGLPLAAMSVGDSITLCALLMQAIFHITPKGEVPTVVLSSICKFGIFLIHSTSAFSVWCWFFLSVLRYIAVFHPFKYRTIWRQPRNALKFLAGAVGMFQIYTLIFVTYRQEEKSCGEYDVFHESAFKHVHLLDIFLFYAIPSLLRITLDFLVLIHCYSPFSVEGLDRVTIDRRYAISGPATTKRFSHTGETDTLDNKAHVALAISITASTNTPSVKRIHHGNPKKKTAMVMRSILISVLNLLLNLPSHIFRAWASYDESSLENEIVRTLEPIAQMMYFSQFACNAFYLATSIYETNGSPRNTVISSSNRHVSRCISDDEA
ncbi:putative G-protein coupled receptor AH9.4 [Caenorhabditis elegans]|uniref:Probable G-protein coupled receptor AH9.4 n=1 Tax=Caenorhabditis elegans TaxID=6239 RepID=YWO4_CAEEL|nr:putative G-protein coupled receptor AH9.4 [Caenorhabditis elegans]Q10907.2 RecName: Full=Probable G-protein coupled receptor AH9.4 [Caenorhabditis elegans]CCD61186.1 Probable G-protein coupled receptor AH9.4 [Caenorhabditis elegans]|eukprot:NP_508417.2 Probable G-protein coupled receptor AH9.4 [Caenorhabditis elegans]